MKLLSSFILGVGLLAPGGLALAADAPLAGAASPSAPLPVPLEADGVTFGMNAESVAKLYDRWWEKHFIPKYRKANPGPRTRELDFELAENKKVLRRVAIFDGRSTSFDKADFRDEFAHGNGETMTSTKVVRRLPGSGEAKGVNYTRRFFFFQDKLWKIYDEYRLDPQGPFGADFKEAASRVEASVGAGAKRTRGPDSGKENVVFEAGNSRVRVVKLAANRIAVVRSDNALAKEVLDRRAQQAKLAGEAPPLDEDIQAVIR